MLYRPSTALPVILAVLLECCTHQRQRSYSEPIADLAPMQFDFFPSGADLCPIISSIIIIIIVIGN